jgi:hypothetical protein
MEQRRPGLPAHFRVEQQRRSESPAWLASSGAAAVAGLAQWSGGGGRACLLTRGASAAAPPARARLQGSCAARAHASACRVVGRRRPRYGVARRRRQRVRSSEQHGRGTRAPACRGRVAAAAWPALVACSCERPGDDSCERVATQLCEQTQVAVRPCLRSGSAREQRRTQAAIPCSLALLAVAALFARAVLASHALFSLLFAIGK